MTAALTALGSIWKSPSQRAQALEALDTLLNAAQNLAAQNLERTHRLTARPRRASRVRRSRLMRTAHTLLGRLHAHNRMSTGDRRAPPTLE